MRGKQMSRKRLAKRGHTGLVPLYTDKPDPETGEKEIIGYKSFDKTKRGKFKITQVHKAEKKKDE